MGLSTGLLRGFGDAVTQQRADRAREQETQLARDQKIFEHLSTADDPEIRMAAIAGMESLASGTYKQKKGIDRFLGRGGVTANPHVARIFEMMRTGGFEGTSSAPPKQAPQTQVQPQTPHIDQRVSVEPEQGRLPPGVNFEGGPPPTPLLMQPAQAGGGHPAMAGARFQAPERAGQAAQAAATPMAVEPPPQPNAPVRQARYLFNPKSVDIYDEASARQRAEVDVQRDYQTSIGITPAEQKEMALAEARQRASGSTAAPYGAPQSYQLSDGTPVVTRQGRATGDMEVLRNGRWVPAESVGGVQPRTNTGVNAPRFLGNVRGSSLPPGTLDNAGRPVAPNQMYRRTQMGDAEEYAPIDTTALSAEDLGRRATATTVARNEANAIAPPDTGQRQSALMGLQDDWRKASSETQTMSRSLQVMQTALSRAGADPAGASEAFRTAFVTMFDPNATVREGDYARLGLGLSGGQRIEGFIQSLITGGGNIPVGVMQQMVETARQVSLASNRWNDVERKRLTDTAMYFGVPAHLVFGENPAALGPATGARPPNPNAPPATGLQATQPGDPQKGAVVGNPLPQGARTGTRPDGTRVAQLPDGSVVPILQDASGQWVY